MAGEPAPFGDDREPGRPEELVLLGPAVRPADGERRVGAGVPAARDEPDESRPEPVAPRAIEVVDDDAPARDPAELAKESDGVIGFEVVDDERAVGDVVRRVGVREPGLRHGAEGEPGNADEAGSEPDGRGDDLRSRVDRRDGEASPAPAGVGEERDRDVGAARPHVEKRDRCHDAVGEPAEPPPTERDPAEKPVHPAQVEEVRVEGRVVLERPIELLVDAFETVHPAGHLAPRRHGPGSGSSALAAQATLSAMFRSNRRLFRVLAPLGLAILLVAPTALPASALSPAYPSLSHGNRGSDVRALQALLVERGHPITVDGVFWLSVREAVADFQGSRGLAATGIVDASTWTRLTRVLASGSTGDAVRAVQRLLNEKRGTKLAVTGSVDSPTRAAIVAFQRHMGIRADGVVASATWRALLGHFELPSFPLAAVCDYSVGNGPANWGTGEAIAQLEAAASTVHAAGFGPVAVGDIGFEHGGDIPLHETHERGLDVDLRPMRDDRRQCTSPSNWRIASYDREATRALMKAIRAKAPGHVKVIYFNDPVLIREGLSTALSGHDDHVHIRYCERAHPVPSYRC
jgi:peptidoglycan hydrolase-like protein with peptidoglycan-binding domain